MKMQLEWLGDALTEQQDAIVDALAKDPLAGRHEIMAQEAKKAIRDSSLSTVTSGMRLSVKDWRTANHMELRARMLHENQKAQTAAVVDAYKAGKLVTTISNNPKGSEGEKAAMKSKLREYYLGLEVQKSTMASEKTKTIQAAYSKQLGGPKPPPSAPAGDQMASLTGWRANILHAKKTAALTLGGLLAWKGEVKGLRRLQGPARVDSFSFYIANQLGEETHRYGMEADRLASLTKALENAQEHLDDARAGRVRSRANSRATSRAHSPAGSEDGGAGPASPYLNSKPTPSIATSPFARPSTTPPGPIQVQPPFRPGKPRAGPTATSPKALVPSRPSTRQGPTRSSVAAAKAANVGPVPALGRASGTLPKPPHGAAPDGTTPRPQVARSISLKKTVTMMVRDGQASPGAAYANANAKFSRMASRKGGFKTSITGHGAVPHATEEELRASEKLVEITSLVEKPRKMMAMYCHRANSRWAEQQHWDPAHVTHQVRLAAEGINGGQTTVFRDAAIKMLQTGGLAMQIFVGEEVVALSSAHLPFDLWQSDPWSLLRMMIPAKAEGVEALSNITMGPRLLLGLAAALESIAGPDAVQKLHVIIHCNENQESSIVSDLVEKRHCGLNPDNVLIVPQQARHGYVWDNQQETFVSTRQKLRSVRTMARATSRGVRSSSGVGEGATAKVTGLVVAMRGATASGAIEKRRSISRNMSRASSSNRRSTGKGHPGLGAAIPAGTGYAMMQMAWEGEAQLVSPDGSTKALHTTAIEYLAERGVKWMMTRRLRDLALYDPATVIDADTIAACLWLNESQGATGMVWVDMVASIQAAAAGLQGIVLGQKEAPAAGTTVNPWAAPARGRTTSVAGLPFASPAIRQQAQAANGGGSAPGSVRSSKDTGGKVLPHGPPPIPVVDLEPAALVSPKLAGVLSEVKAKVKGAGLPASTRRYMWYLPALQEALSLPSSLRPILTVRGPSTHVSFDCAQLTGSAAIHTAALCAGPRQLAKTISTPEDADDLMAVMKAQDSNGTFRRMLAHSLSAGSRGAGANGEPLPPSLSSATDAMLGDPEGLKAKEWSGKRVVMLVKDTHATNMALQLTLALLKPGKDMLLLVAVAGGGLAAENATRNTLHKFLTMARSAAVDCAAQMIPKAGQPLLELIEDFTDDAEADLVVLASRGRAAGGVAAMGSVAYGLMKHLTCPMLVVKESARNADIAWEKDPVRMMIPVDHGSRGLLRWAAEKLLNAQRQDKVLLARADGGPKEKDPHMGKRMLDNFSDILFSSRITGVKKQLTGSYEQEGVKWSDAEKAHIQALHAPAGKNLPEHVLRVLTATRSALLLYKGGAN